MKWLQLLGICLILFFGLTNAFHLIVFQSALLLSALTVAYCIAVKLFPVSDQAGIEHLKAVKLRQLKSLLVVMGCYLLTWFIGWWVQGLHASQVLILGPILIFWPKIREYLRGFEYLVLHKHLDQLQRKYRDITLDIDVSLPEGKIPFLLHTPAGKFFVNLKGVHSKPSLVEAASKKFGPVIYCEAEFHKEVLILPNAIISQLGHFVPINAPKPEPDIEPSPEQFAPQIVHTPAQEDIDAFWKMLETIKDWYAFELLVRDIYRAKYGKADLTEKTTHGDGGIDILVERDSIPIPIQCKLWSKPVGVKVVRELAGVMHAQNYPVGIIASLSGPTYEAKQFSSDVEWVDFKSLVLLFKSLPAKKASAIIQHWKGKDITTPSCPKCLKEMVRREGPYSAFWGCRNYPKCRGTLKGSF